MSISFDDAALVRHLCELEESLLLPDVRKSERLAERLADNVLEFGSSERRYTKAGINVFCLQDFEPTGIPVRQATGASLP